MSKAVNVCQVHNFIGCGAPVVGAHNCEVGSAQTGGGAAHISVPFSQLAFDRGSQLDEQANAVKKLAPS